MTPLEVGLSQVAVPLKVWWVVEVTDRCLGRSYRATVEFLPYGPDSSWWDVEDEPSLRFYVRRTWWRGEVHGVVVSVFDADRDRLVREVRLTRSNPTS